MKEAGTSIQLLRTELKEAGLRCTRPRESVLGFFREKDRHVSAEQLHRIMQERGKSFSLSTIYLNLGILTEVGLIREIVGLEGEKLYDSNHHHHHHIICRYCQEVADVHDDYQQQMVHLPQGWQLEQHEILFYGCCPKCKAKLQASQKKTVKCALATHEVGDA